MTLPLFFFYVFSIIAIASGLMVISSRNPVHSVLFLILAFVNASGLFLLAGAFLALILVVVYVGAVAVLFLFVVMMLDIDFRAMRQGLLQYMPIGALIGIIMLLELLLVAGSFVVTPHLANANLAPIAEGVSNTKALGAVLYTRYVFIFEAAGGVLLVAMIGAIVLTLQHRVSVKRQDAARQSRRKRSEGVEIVSVKSGQGL